jgi:mevalonate kinase
MTKELYSNGKLLLTGEYAILDGAKGLALPTKFGQYLKLQSDGSESLVWKSIDENDKVWFNAKFSKVDLNTVVTSNVEISNRLVQVLLEAKRLNPSFLSKTIDYTLIETKLTFPKNWGLGSSSTLISNIAQWAEVDPYRLLATTFGGSGYDIACARHDKPILYTNRNYTPKVNEVNFLPIFSDRLFFVYLNQKKNSRDAIKAYRNLAINKSNFISKIDDITERILNCSHLKEFENLLSTHEQIISDTLKIPTIKDSLFADYPGTIKSLGAWGGDFILATGTTSEMEYFKKQGYATVLSYAEMIL